MAERKDNVALIEIPAGFWPPSTSVNVDALMTDTVVIKCGSAEMAERIETCIEIARAVCLQQAGRERR